MDVTPDELDKETREGLLSMPKDLADLIAVHLIAAERALGEEDPDRAYEHAKVARRFGSRVGVVREAAGIAAYRAGHFAEALNDLRAARRLMGSDDLLPMLADCERGLGRPERALDLVRSPEAERAGRAVQVELAIVESGARRDLGQKDAAIVTLQRLPELRDSRPHPWSARLAFAYADALADAGHDEAAADWFSRAMTFDEDGETDAAERYAELTGMDIEDIQDVEEDVEYLDGDVEDSDELGAESDEARNDVLVEDDEAEPTVEADDVRAEAAEADSGREAAEAQASDPDGGSGDEPVETGPAVEGEAAGEARGTGSGEESAEPEAAVDDADGLDLDEEVRAKLADADAADADADDDADDDAVAEAGEAVTPTTGRGEAKPGESAAPAEPDADAASAGGAIGLGPAFIEPDFGDDDAHGASEPGKREG